MKVSWHKWPEEKPPQSGQYWLVMAWQYGDKPMCWVEDPTYYDAEDATFYDPEYVPKGPVLAWAWAETPELPELRVQLRPSGLNYEVESVEWLDEAPPPVGSIPWCLQELAKISPDVDKKQWQVEVERIIVNMREQLGAKS